MLTKDCVCGMQVESGANQVVYLGMPYSFCSEQCQERFLANPHLYIGLPGQKEPKQQGISVIKRRRMRLAQPLSTEQINMLASMLRTMMGIKSIGVDGDRIEIDYDLLEVTAQQIEEKLTQVGLLLGEGLAERLRRAFVHYEEECEVENMEVHEDKFTYRHPG